MRRILTKVTILKFIKAAIDGNSEMDTRSAVEQVLDIEIILIEILLYLSVKDMLLAARTCRH